VGEGTHTVELMSDRPDMAKVTVSFCGEHRDVPAVGADWPQLQGGPRHLGATEVAVVAPLQVVWARAIGGHLRGGSPVLAAGKLYVPVVDPAGGERGGVVALDALTGEVRWEARLGRSVHNAPAVAGNLVVVSAEDGVVHALAADTGVERWAVALSTTAPAIAASLFASPTIVDGIVYVGVVGNFAAIDATTGAVMWQVDPAPTGHVDATYSSVAIEDRVVVGLFGYGAAVGLSAFDVASGSSLWKQSGELSVGSAISPIIIDGRVYGGDGASDIYAADLRTGEVAWQVKLDDSGGQWSYLIGATPAIAGGRIFVPTHADRLFALGQSDGATLWTIEAEEGVLHPVHYRSTTRSFASSPVATGNILWVGAADGWLRAVDVESGDILWSVDLGAPVLSGVVPASPWLYVSTWDGTVRGMVTRGMLPPRPPPDEGCSVGGGGTASLLLLAALYWRRRRKKHLDS
jgi:MYXO-CTERM domain-containing protein